MTPLAKVADSLTGVSIPGEANTLSAEDTARFASDAGMPASTADSVLDALQKITAQDPHSRVLICGSLYLAGAILRENG